MYLNKVGTALTLGNVKMSYKGLRLIYFFTAGYDEVKCWEIRHGTLALHAACKYKQQGRKYGDRRRRHQGLQDRRDLTAQVGLLPKRHIVSAKCGVAILAKSVMLPLEAGWKSGQCCGLCVRRGRKAQVRAHKVRLQNVCCPDAPQSRKAATRRSAYPHATVQAQAPARIHEAVLCAVIARSASLRSVLLPITHSPPSTSR